MSYDANLAKSIFLQAMELPSPSDRAAFVATACAGQPELQARVEMLLQTALDPDSLLDKPVAEIDATVVTPREADGMSLEFLQPSDAPGSLGRLGAYTILEVIGRGGMGIVLRAMDSKLNRVVAVKVLAPEYAGNTSARKRFLREAKAAAAVSHDHVVTIYAVDGDEKLPLLVMECIVGQSLQQKIDKVGALRLTEILRIGMQAAAGLAAAHGQGLVHRDVKPANILLENGIERVKLTDFGLARMVDDASVTQSGVIAGTPQYMSPEQARGDAVDHRSDLFSLGCVLYAMCVGHAPFRASTTMGVLKRVCEETPRPIRDCNPDIPEWLARIVEKLLAKSPSDRFQTAAEVAELLRQCLAHVQQPTLVELPEAIRCAGDPVRSTVINRPAVAPLTPQQSTRVAFGIAVWAIACFLMISLVGWLLWPAAKPLDLNGVWDTSYIGPVQFVHAPIHRTTKTIPVTAKFVSQGTVSVEGRIEGELNVATRTIAGDLISDASSARVRLTISQDGNSILGSYGWRQASGDEALTAHTWNMQRRVGVREVAQTAPGGSPVLPIISEKNFDWQDVASQLGTPPTAQSVAAATESERRVTGTPSPKGVRLDLAVNPHQSQYAMNDMITITPILHNEGPETIEFSMPRLEVLEKFGLDFTIENEAQAPTKWTWGKAHKSREELTVAGALSTKLQPGRPFELPSLKVVIGTAQAPNDAMICLEPKAGQFCRLRLNLSSYSMAKDDGEPLQSGWLEFRIVDPTMNATDSLAKNDVATSTANKRRLLKRFDPHQDKPTASFRKADQAEITVQDGAWRFENNTNTGNFYMSMPSLLDKIPDEGLIICRALIKLEPKDPKAWGGLQLGDADPSFHKYDWPAELYEYRGTVAEWTAKEVRYPAKLFHERNPPQITVRFGLHADGVMFIKDVELLHLPEDHKRPAKAITPFDAAQAEKHQEAWAKSLNFPVTRTNSIDMTLRLIPPGQFQMGSTSEELAVLKQELESTGASAFEKFVAGSSGPKHAVELSQPYYMGTHEVTMAQFHKFIEETGHIPSAEKAGNAHFTWKNFVTDADAAKQPVCGVSWQDAKDFCKWLTEKTASDANPIDYDLPTEAQWEFACRAGSQSRWSFGDNEQELTEHAIVGQRGVPTPAAVGLRRANAFGLYDMHGNVDEWCLDWHNHQFYARSPLADPFFNDAPKDAATGKVSRGGSWNADLWWSRSASRTYDFPVTPAYAKGFRVVGKIGTQK